MIITINLLHKEFFDQKISNIRLRKPKEEVDQDAIEWFLVPVGLRVVAIQHKKEISRNLPIIQIQKLKSKVLRYVHFKKFLNQDTKLRCNEQQWPNFRIGDIYKGM